MSRADLRRSLDEDDETFSVVLSNPVNFTIVDDTGVGTITDDDPPPALSVNDVTVTEGDWARRARPSRPRSPPPSGLPVVGQLRDRERLGGRPGRLRHAVALSTSRPASPRETVTVDVNGDLLDEANETFFLDLSGASNATISGRRGVGTITDDDAVADAVGQ